MWEKKAKIAHKKRAAEASPRARVGEAATADQRARPFAKADRPKLRKLRTGA